VPPLVAPAATIYRSHHLASISRPAPVLLIVGPSPVSLDPGLRSRVYFPGMIAETTALTTGAVAQRAGVPLDTVRYYERRGLLRKPPRTAAGYRLYPGDTVRRVTFIKRAQALGFTLEEIAELLALRISSEDGCRAVERQARAVIGRIDAKVAELSRMRSALGRLATACHGDHLPDECPMLAALDSQPLNGHADDAAR